MRVFVRCDRNGIILSVAKVHTMAEEIPHPFSAVSGEDDQVIEIDAGDEVARLDPHEIVEQFVVERSSSTLRKRGTANASRGTPRAAAKPKKGKSK